MQDVQDLQYLQPQEAARILSVSTQTLREYEKNGMLTPDEVKRTPGGKRRYLASAIAAVGRGERSKKDVVPCEKAEAGGFEMAISEEVQASFDAYVSKFYEKE